MKKISDMLTVVLFCAAVAAFTAAFILLPRRDFSEQENRALAPAPELNAESFFGGGFGAQTNVWFADQFPLRDGLVKLKSAAELALGKQSNNGVLYNFDQLAVKQFNAYLSRLKTLNDCDGFFASSAAAQARNLTDVGGKLAVPMITLIPPRTVDVCGRLYGEDGHGDALFETLDENFGESAGYIDLYKAEKAAFERGEYVIYRTDHHWTTYGAYLAYAEVMKRLGREDEIIPQNAFAVEKTDSFFGTTYSRANFPFCKGDTLEIWTLDDEDAYSVVADGKELGGFYDRSFLKAADKYSAFLGGTHAETLITRKDAERETLLVIKDSFANCLIPFLARSMDIAAIDVKSGYDVTKLAEKYGASAVLIVCNAENVVSYGELGRLY